MAPTGWILLIVVTAFVAFLVFKARIDPRQLRGHSAQRTARQRIAAAKRRARRARRDIEAKADGWREAARIALDDLDRPSLAASYALRALRANPNDAEAVSLLADGLSEAGRLRALERLLWRRLDGPNGAGRDRAYDALVALYEGPLTHRAKARALRSLRERAGHA